MMDIGCRSIFDSDQDMFREVVRKWMREQLAPQQDRFEEEGQPSSWPRSRTGSRRRA